MFSQRSRGQSDGDAATVTAQTGLDPAVLAAGVSVILSWYYFFGRGERHLGLFVGLWPPTILAFASYFKQTSMSDTLETATGADIPWVEVVRSRLWESN